MTNSDDTRLDQNIKRVDVGAVVTVLNADTHKRQHYYISPDGTSGASIGRHANTQTVKPTDDIAKVLIGKMKGEKVFFRHDLVIEFIEWPVGS